MKILLFLTFWNIVLLVLHPWTSPYVDLTYLSIFVFLGSQFLVYCHPKFLPSLTFDEEAKTTGVLMYLADFLVHWAPLGVVLIVLPYRSEYTPLKTCVTFLAATAFAVFTESIHTYHLDSKGHERAIQMAALSSIIFRFGVSQF